LLKEECVIISDMDMIPTRKSYYCRDYPEDKITHLRGDIMYKEIVICYNVGSPQSWKNLFPVNSVDDVIKFIKSWYTQYGGSSDIQGGKGWNIDQRVLYDRWQQNLSLYNMLEDKKQDFKRLDRVDDEKSYTRDTFISLAKEQYSDYHMHRPYSDYKETIDKVLDILLNIDICREIFGIFANKGRKKVELIEKLVDKSPLISINETIKDLFFFDICHQYLIDGYYINKKKSSRSLQWLEECNNPIVWKQMSKDSLFANNIQYYKEFPSSQKIINKLNVLLTKTVTVIIPSYNRYKYLLDAVESVKKQTYPQNLITIIVINDGSTENYKDIDGCINISLGQYCSRKVLGYGYPGFSRNYGLRLVKSDYIAFLDDDDIWLPNKLMAQITKMEEEKIMFSCTDGYYGRGRYDKNKNYAKYNKEHHRQIVLSKLNISDYPNTFERELLLKHNFAITSSVVINTDMVKKVGLFVEDKNKAEDYDYWLRCLEHGKGLYIEDTLFYYDGGTSVEYTYNF
jgi:GT2 family glycosyltransferase